LVCSLGFDGVSSVHFVWVMHLAGFRRKRAVHGSSERLASTRVDVFDESTQVIAARVGLPDRRPDLDDERLHCGS